MTVEEAREVLDLKENFTENQVKSAYRRKITEIGLDRGFYNKSEREKEILTEQSARVNSARSILLCYLKCTEVSDSSNTFYDNMQNMNKEGWVKYDKGSCCENLVGISKEFNINTLLRFGDVYVYYASDSMGSRKKFRLLISMQNSDVVNEIYGADNFGNVEFSMLKILKEKIEQFPVNLNRDVIIKNIQLQLELLEIENKINNNMSLSLRELKVLYEIVDGVGFSLKPFGRACKDNNVAKKLEQLIKKRNISKDLETIFIDVDKCYYGGYNYENLNDIKFDKIDFFMGDLHIYDRQLLSKVFPKYVTGELDLEEVRIIVNVELPKYVGKDVNMWSLNNIRNSRFPEYIGGELTLFDIKSIENVIFSKYVGGSVFAPSLLSARNVIFPEIVVKSFMPRSLCEIENVKFPIYVGHDFELTGLKRGENILFPKYVGGDFLISSVEELINVEFPDYVGGNFLISSVEELINVEFPYYVGGIIELYSLKSPEGLKLPFNFNLDNLRAQKNVIEEIKANPTRYFKLNPLEHNIDVCKVRKRRH